MFTCPANLLLRQRTSLGRRTISCEVGLGNFQVRQCTVARSCIANDLFPQITSRNFLLKAQYRTAAQPCPGRRAEMPEGPVDARSSPPVAERDISLSLDCTPACAPGYVEIQKGFSHLFATPLKCRYSTCGCNAVKSNKGIEARGSPREDPLEAKGKEATTAKAPNAARERKMYFSNIQGSQNVGEQPPDGPLRNMYT